MIGGTPFFGLRGKSRGVTATEMGERQWRDRRYECGDGLVVCLTPGQRLIFSPLIELGAHGDEYIDFGCGCGLAMVIVARAVPSC